MKNALFRSNVAASLVALVASVARAGDDYWAPYFGYASTVDILTGTVAVTAQYR